MSKISCVAARKHDLSGGFANVWDGVLNSYKIVSFYTLISQSHPCGWLFFNRKWKILLVIFSVYFKVISSYLSYDAHSENNVWIK